MTTGAARATETRPLEGVAVLVPRTPDQADALSGRIRDLGGEPVEAPTIAILPGDVDGLVDALREVAKGTFTAVCLTSPNGVDAVADALDRAGLDPDVLTRALVAVVGPGTGRALRRTLGVEPALMPDRSTTATLAAAFPPGEGRVLLPRADIASETLPETLRQRGYEPVTVDAYVTGLPDDLPPEAAARLEAGEVDILAFTSSSTVRNFVELTAELDWSGRVVSIGPVTSRTCRELGLEVAVEASRHDLGGLVDAIVEAAQGRSPA